MGRRLYEPEAGGAILKKHVKKMAKRSDFFKCSASNTSLGTYK
jgi:hypothetical protein